MCKMCIQNVQENNICVYCQYKTLWLQFITSRVTKQRVNLTYVCEIYFCLVSRSAYKRYIDLHLSRVFKVFMILYNFHNMCLFLYRVLGVWVFVNGWFKNRWKRRKNNSEKKVNATWRLYSGESVKKVELEVGVVRTTVEWG